MAEIIADILQACEPHYGGSHLRAKVDFSVLERAKLKVRDLAVQAGIDYEPAEFAYPHFYYLDDEVDRESSTISYEIVGEKIREFLNYMLSSDIESLEADQSQPTHIYTPEGCVEGMVTCLTPRRFILTVPVEKAGLALAWLRSVSDGYVKVAREVLPKVTGPVIVRVAEEDKDIVIDGDPHWDEKPYSLGIPEWGGCAPINEGETLPEFVWEEKEQDELRRTSLYDLHKELGGRMVPFAGWEMPVQYASVMEEHLAVREAAGLFDVSHMGVYQAEGPDAMAFLDSVCANDISSLDVGEALYTHFLDTKANVIDDLLVYRREDMKYMAVVNASNDDKDWAWLNAVRKGEVRIDEERPWVRTFGRNVILRNLGDSKEGDDMLVDIALQGPRSQDILFELEINEEDRRDIRHLRWAELCEATVNGMEIVVSQTGYTGEHIGYELFVHPDKAEELFRILLEVGEPYGLKPCGLGARDSLRTEAGLPLYGHEMGGEMALGVAEAGFGSYVKTHKPWFIGREAFLAREEERDSVVVRFRFDDQRVRKAHYGDPVLDGTGRVIGRVTSCANDSDGYFLGQAYVLKRFAKRGTLIYIYQDVSKRPGKNLAELSDGERVALPNTAKIIRRFPRF